MDVFLDDASIRSVIRALCAADIVVADVTGYDPSLLLLLGIRAAVRRSITIACTAESMTLDLWRDLPFNLRELNLVSFQNEDHGHKAMTETIRAGLAQSIISTRYLDLPVYDYIREDSSDSDSRASGDQRVLLLRAFQSYGDDRKTFVQKRICDGFKPGRKVIVESVIDQRSPRLAGQRLYEAIRHWNCVLSI